MNRFHYPLWLCILALLMSCAVEKGADKIIDRAISNAGGKSYESNLIAFTFRDKFYSYKNDEGWYEYVRQWEDSLGFIRDVLTNNEFRRYVNGKEVPLVDSLAEKYSNSVNSVMYFVLLPYGLSGSAVKKELLGEKVIKGKTYYKIRITFNLHDEENDHDDVYLYWIGKSDYAIDYLAYQYKIHGGGMRFREAINPRVVNGIRFVDYINYHPKDSIQFIQIDDSFINGNLEQLSVIENRDITVRPISR